MKALLFFSLASCAGLYGLGQLAGRVNSTLASPDLPPGTLELGIRAITGQLTADRLAELEPALKPVLAVRESVQPQPQIADVSTSDRQNTRPAVEPMPRIVAAWGDGGQVFVRLASGEVFRRLDSGALVAIAQPSNDCTADFVSAHP